MTEDRNVVKNKDFCLYMIVDFIICFLFFMPFLQLHFSNDSYTTMELQKMHSVSDAYISSGRYIGALIVKVLDMLKIDLVNNTAFAVFVFMLCSVYCMAQITCRCIEEREDWLKAAVVQLGTITGFCNVFIAEWYCFTEVLIVYAAAVLSCVFAAILFDKKNQKFLSFILLLVGYNCYQPAISIYVFLILFFILKKYKFEFDIKAVKETLACALECVGVFFINYLLTKLLILLGIIVDSRYTGAGLGHIIDNIKLLLQYQHLIWVDADGMMNLPFMAVGIVFMVCLFVIVCWQKKRFVKDFFYTLIMLAGGVAVVFLPLVIQEVFWAAPRSIVPLFFIYTVLAFYIAFQGKKWVKSITAVGLCFFLVVMMHFVHCYMEDLLYSSSMDRQYISIVEQKIEEYERENDIKVEYLGFVSDANIQWRWDLQGQYAWDVAEKGITVGWSQVHIFNYYTGRSYGGIDVPEEYKQYYLQNDWDRLDVEVQVRFEENKCYIAVF